MVPQLFCGFLLSYLKFGIRSPMAFALARMINCPIESDTSQLSQIIVRPYEFKNSLIYQKMQINYVMCHMPHVTCHMSHVTCRVSHITCHMSLVTFPLLPTLTATATDPALANSPLCTVGWFTKTEPKTQKRPLKAPLWHKYNFLLLYLLWSLTVFKKQGSFIKNQIIQQRHLNFTRISNLRARVSETLTYKYNNTMTPRKTCEQYFLAGIYCNWNLYI